MAEAKYHHKNIEKELAAARREEASILKGMQAAVPHSNGPALEETSATQHGEADLLQTLNIDLQ